MYGIKLYTTETLFSMKKLTRGLCDINKLLSFIYLGKYKITKMHVSLHFYEKNILIVMTYNCKSKACMSISVTFCEKKCLFPVIYSWLVSIKYNVRQYVICVSMHKMIIKAN